MTQAGPPKVSVVLRTYDHEAFIAQAIESVLIQQTSFPFELVIGEDCSTDGTREIVRAYAERNPTTINAILPERNLGHGEIFRRALAAASGEFVAYLDGDDYWTSAEKLVRQVEYLEQNPSCANCFHDVSLVYDSAGMPSGAISPRFADGQFNLEQIVMECFVPAPAMMFRRAVADGLRPWVFDSAWIDWLIHIRSAELGPIGYIPEPMAVYRVHQGGMFSAMDRVSQLEEDIDFYARLLPELPKQGQLIQRCLAYRHAQLAIERLGVPLEACVILVDPRRELRPYFNGRHARNLPRREGSEVTELEAIREAARELPPAVRDYGAYAQAPQGDAGCYVVVPGGSAEWLDEHPNLRAYLAREGKLAWEDEWAAIHELEPRTEQGSLRGARGARRVEVEMLVGTLDVPACFLDAPAAGEHLPAHAVMVTGWVVGADGPAISVEFEADGVTVWRAPVNRERPDVADAFPDLAGDRAGFQTTLNMLELPDGGLVTVVAVFADGERRPLATLRPRVPGEPEPTAAG
jgi:glycosyltransferase involved in cell wall biosynthesis